MMLCVFTGVYYLPWTAFDTINLKTAAVKQLQAIGLFGLMFSKHLNSYGLLNRKIIVCSSVGTGVCITLEFRIISQVKICDSSCQQ